MATARTLRHAVTLAASAAGVFAAALPVLAVQIVPACALQVGKEPPTLDCVLTTFAGIAQLILGITGSFALLMFIYGGFVMLSSAGDSGKVSEGKTILKNAIIGILIIFTSGYVIQYGMQQLGGVNSSGEQQVIIGQECAGGQGRTFSDRGDQCFTDCASLGNYSCKVPSPEAESGCYAGLCQNSAANVRCCPN